VSCVYVIELFGSIESGAFLPLAETTFNALLCYVELFIHARSGIRTRHSVVKERYRIACAFDLEDISCLLNIRKGKF
jgi:hypothetical protein